MLVKQYVRILMLLCECIGSIDTTTFSMRGLKRRVQSLNHITSLKSEVMRLIRRTLCPRFWRIVAGRAKAMADIGAKSSNFINTKYRIAMIRVY